MNPFTLPVSTPVPNAHGVVRDHTNVSWWHDFEGDFDLLLFFSIWLAQFTVLLTHQFRRLPGGIWTGSSVSVGRHSLFRNWSVINTYGCVGYPHVNRDILAVSKITCERLYWLVSPQIRASPLLRLWPEMSTIIQSILNALIPPLVGLRVTEVRAGSISPRYPCDLPQF